MFWGRQESVERLALIFCTFLQTGEYKNFIVSGTPCINVQDFHPLERAPGAQTKISTVGI